MAYKTSRNGMMMFRPLVITMVLLCSQLSYGQLCNNPVTTCADASPDAEQLIPSPFTFQCMDVTQSAFYSFQTNNNADAAGEVVVSITSINCPGSAGADSVVAMVFEYQQGTDPCDPSNWSNATGCFSDTLAIEFVVENVQANSQYFIVVGSNQDFSNGACAYEVSISGEPVDLQATVEPIQISLGESAQLNVSGGDILTDPLTGDTLSSYSWSPTTWLDDPNIPNPVSTPEETTTYVVQGNIGDCVVTDLVTVIVGPPILIYNTFSPNGDGINDTWTLEGIEMFENCKIHVYSRWGQSVFKSVGYTTPWDGTNG
ncbi:MAG: gliding motility-associated C-terminal domain-containing protein, partial [Flavobacteriales bacterium]|nr:gliding motility-associated C-terminal domain-containing protein [Flavobacteriales bacterium]